jgi:hypothetical protein
MAWSGLYNEATLSTERWFAKKVVDQVFNSNPFAMRLKRDAKTLDGGESLELSSLFAKGDGTWFTEWETYPAVHKEQLDAGRLDWKLYTTPVVLSHLQLLKNSASKERRFDLAMQKNIAASKTAADDLGTAVFATGDAAGDPEIDSIDRAVAAGTTVYAGITRATSGDTLQWAATVDSSTTTLTLADLQTSYGNAQEGDERPNLSVTTQANFNRYWNLLTPIQRLGSDEMGKAGFTSLLFNGHPVVVDSHVATNYWYNFNMNHIELAAHKQAFFSFERAVMPTNQWVHIGRYYFVGNLLCHAPRYQAKLTALAA